MAEIIGDQAVYLRFGLLKKGLILLIYTTNAARLVREHGRDHRCPIFASAHSPVRPCWVVCKGMDGGFCSLFSVYQVYGIGFFSVL
jgi:hypothetical protein